MDAPLAVTPNNFGHKSFLGKLLKTKVVYQI